MEFLEQLKEKHIELWSWLADNPLMDKKDWPGWDKLDYEVYGEAIDNLCFACHADSYIYNEKEETGLCGYCPCFSLWERNCGNDNSSYIKWKHAMNSESRTCLAKEIRDGWK